MNWKSRIWKLIGWRTKNERRTDEERWRMAENLHGFAHENVSEALRKHLGLDFLHGNMFFHPKQLKCIAWDVWDPLEQPHSPIYSQNAVEVATLLAKARPGSPKRADGFLRKFPKAPPKLISSPPLFVLYKKVMEALRKHFGLDFPLFSLPFHQY